MGATEYPYHEDDGSCEMYSANDIITIYTTLSMLKTSQLTYHNQLKHYIDTLESPEDIIKVKYGQELTGEYLDNFNSIVEQTQSQISTILTKLSNN